MLELGSPSQLGFVEPLKLFGLQLRVVGMLLMKALSHCFEFFTGFDLLHIAAGGQLRLVAVWIAACLPCPFALAAHQRNQPSFGGTLERRALPLHSTDDPAADNRVMSHKGVHCQRLTRALISIDIVVAPAHPQPGMG